MNQLTKVFMPPFSWAALLLLAALSVSTWVVNNRSRQSTTRVDMMQSEPVLGILVNRQMQIVDLDWWSPAKRAGVQRGDILKKMGAVSLPPTLAIDPPDAQLPRTVPAVLRGTADLRTLFHQLVPAWNSRLTLVVERAGRQLTIPVVVSAQPPNYNPADPPPTVTPVPDDLASSEFYL